MEYLPVFLALLASVLFATAFRRFHLPWVLALISAGVVIGPGLNLVEVTPTLSFLSEIGLIFLMFMAGLETNVSSFKHFTANIAWLAIPNSLIPFAIGAGIGMAFGFDLIAALLLGAIFMSSSIAVIIPTLEATGLITRKLGRSIVAATIVADVASLVVLSILLQSVDPVTALPLPSFYGLLLVILAAFWFGLPKLRALVPQRRDERDLFESEVRIIVALLIGVVVTFEFLGLHPIIAGFFTGLVLSESITSELLIEKLRTISYGIFIPVFFVVIGLETDVGVFLAGGSVLGLIAAVIGGSILAKLSSGYLGGRLAGFSAHDALVAGVATTPQLSTTLAVVFSAVELELLDPELVTAMVTLSIVTTLIAPLALRALTAKR